MTATETRSTLATNGVDFVHKDNGGGVLSGRGEEIAHAARAHADEHLHEVRPRHREERNLGLSGHRTGEHRLSGSGRAHQQHALRNFGADVGEAPGVLEEVNDFADFLLDTLVTGDVGKRRLRVVLVELLRLGATHGHHAVHLAARLAAGQQHQSTKQDNRKEVGENQGQEARRVREVDVDVVGAQNVDFGRQGGHGATH